MMFFSRSAWKRIHHALPGYLFGTFYGVSAEKKQRLEWCLNPSLGASWMRQPAMVGGQRQEFRGFASFTHKTWDVNQKGYGFKWGSALQ
jgi:hypothetical protein